MQRTEVGSAFLFQLNRNHLAARAVLDLADIRARLLAQITDAVSNFSHLPDTAVLFGSAARGDGDESSDIDLLLVRPDAVDDEAPVWSADVHRLVENVQSWTGNDASVLEYSAVELRELFQADRPLARELRRDAVHLFGKRLPQIGSPTRRARA